MNKLKLNYHKKVFYFALNFLPWDFLLIKTLDFEKTKTTQFTTFKTDIIKVVLLSFFNFQLFYKQKFPGKEIEFGLALVDFMLLIW